MAITVTNLVAANATGSLTTAPVTTVTGRMYLFTVNTSGTQTGGLPTSGGGVTWIEPGNAFQVFNSSYGFETFQRLFYGVCTAGTTGVTWSITALNGTPYIIDEVSGQAVTSPIAQAVNSSEVLSSFCQVTFSSYAASTNTVYGAWVAGDSGVTNIAADTDALRGVATRSGFFQSSFGSLMTQYRLTGGTTDSLTIRGTYSKSTDGRAQAIEIVPGPSGGPKTFSFSSAETEALSPSLIRGRGYGATNAESSTVSSSFIRSRVASATISEAEALSSSLTRARTVSATISEVDATAAALARSRLAAFDVVEAEAVSAGPLSRLRETALAIAEAYSATAALTVQVGDLVIKSFSLAIASAADYTANLRRQLAIAPNIDEASGQATLLSRLRRVAAASAASQVISIAWARTRGYAVRLTELWAHHPTLTKIHVTGVPAHALVEWEQYQTSASGQVTLMQLSKTVTFGTDYTLVRVNGRWTASISIGG